MARVLLARHGQTEWSTTGRHTGTTDIPLLEAGRSAAVRLGERLHRAPWDGLPDAEVRTSPLRAGRARRASWPASATVPRPGTRCGSGTTATTRDSTTPQISERRGRDWVIWRDGVADGESLRELSARADEVVEWARSADRDVLLFAHGHVLRAIGARWLGLDPAFAGHLGLAPASLSVLGWAYGAPALTRWNDQGHLD